MDDLICFKGSGRDASASRADFEELLLKTGSIRVFLESQYDNMVIVSLQNIQGVGHKTSMWKIPMQKLPWAISCLTSVTVLEICSCGMSQLPPEVGRMTALKVLNLNDNYLTDLPEEIGNLKQLEEVYVPYNEFQAVPSVLKTMKSLVKLEIQGNPIKDLGEIPENWERLQFLRIGGKPLKEIPESVSNLKNLETLIAKYAHLKCLPLSLGKLACLKSLNVSSNFLTELPPTLLMCQRLFRLTAYNNLLTSVIPENIIGPVWPDLVELKLNNNCLTTIPRALLDTAKTDFHIYLDQNKITHLPFKLFRMKRTRASESPYSKGSPLIQAYDNPMSTTPTSSSDLRPMSNARSLKELAATKVLDMSQTATFNRAAQISNYMQVCAPPERVRPNLSFNLANLPKEISNYVKCAEPCDNPLCKGYAFENSHDKKYYWEERQVHTNCPILCEWRVCSDHCARGRPAVPFFLC